MCVEYATAIGVDILINTIDKNGNQNQYKKANIKPGAKKWKSNKTKAEYPLSWSIEIAEADILITTTSEVKDQEMIFGQINYWEGPMKVKAKINGEHSVGKGFMELVGYPSNYNYLFVAGEEIEENIFNKIKKFFKKI
jgi:predicted secreted hydrolase